MALVNNFNFGIRRQMLLSMIIIFVFAFFSFTWDKINILLPHILTAVWVAYIFDSIIKYFRKQRLYLDETALITGFLVAFVVDLKASLLIIALISIVWILSKNFILVNKRHIFNPAAFWIVAIWLFFPEVWQSWWQFWSILFNGIHISIEQIVIILWLFIIYKIWRLSTIISYLLVFFIFYTWYNYFMWQMGNIFQDFWLWITKAFILFMLIEPQTSPSTRHKKVIFGGIAAIFTFIFLNLPVFPSLANNWILLWLLIANLYFILSQVYKEKQRQIFYGFIVFAISITILSYTSLYIKNLKNIKAETSKMKKQISIIKSGSGIVKIDKTYVSPGWMDKVNFNIHIKDNKVDSVRVKKVKTNSNSDIYIWLFNDEITSVVKWKSLKDLQNIDVVWSASLTTKAFKDVIKKLKF